MSLIKLNQGRLIMQRALETSTDDLSPEQIQELEEKRLKMLEEAEIDENKVLSNAQDTLNTWNSYFNENITRGKDDLNFTVRDQWTAVERSEFTRLFKPAMTFNKLRTTTTKITGEQRRNKPDLRVRSLTGQASQEEINLREDLVRTISYQSQNDLVYQTAFKSALMMGFGAFQISLDYETPRSFNQVIKFEIITDATRTFFDPKAMLPHKGDGDFCARMHVFGRAEFEATYPYITNPVSFVDPYMLLDFQWQTRDTIVVADYFVKEWYPIIIYELSDGRVVSEAEWDEMQKGIKDQKELAKDTLVVGNIITNNLPQIVNTRQSQDYNLMHYRMLQNQIIDFMEWPSKILPIIFVDGDSYYIEGRQYTTSFVHDARDAQKCINYFGSEIAAEVKNRRREQWLGTSENIKGKEQQWRNPELQLGILIAEPDPKTGAMPMKQPAWDISPGLLQNFQRAGQDVQEILGVSENQILQGRDISGKARRERKLEGAMGSYIYFDNLNQAIAQGGRAVLDLAPYVYGNKERSMVLSKADGRSENIILNKANGEGEMENALSKGDYDIEIDTGPSFAIQKEIALEFLQETLQAQPQVFPLVADLWAKNLDVQFMPQIAERFKTLVPPEILAKESGQPAPPKPPSPQEQMMQQEMMLKQQQLQERAEELKIRQEKHQLEKAKLILDAQKLQSDMHSSAQRVENERHKTDMGFTQSIAKIITDAHK